MNTIALETSVQPGSIALKCNHVTVYEAEFPRDQRTTQSFALQIKAALDAGGLKPHEIDLFTVCLGPGSFTGLRIGTTAAKTFAYASKAMVLGVDTLELIAAQAPICETSDLQVIMDAQRAQLFVASFRVHDDAVTRLTETSIVDAKPWIAQLSHSDRITGPGLQRYGSQLPESVTITDPTCWAPSATTLAEVANKQFASGVKHDLWKLAPNYFRKSAAEEKLEQQE